jgi:hypothetical protein
MRGGRGNVQITMKTMKDDSVVQVWGAASASVRVDKVTWMRHWPTFG